MQKFKEKDAIYREVETNWELLHEYYLSFRCPYCTKFLDDMQFDGIEEGLFIYLLSAILNILVFWYCIMTGHYLLSIPVLALSIANLILAIKEFIIRYERFL